MQTTSTRISGKSFKLAWISDRRGGAFPQLWHYEASGDVVGRTQFLQKGTNGEGQPLFGYARDELLAEIEIPAEDGALSLEELACKYPYKKPLPPLQPVLVKAPIAAPKVRYVHKTKVVKVYESIVNGRGFLDAAGKAVIETYSVGWFIQVEGNFSFRVGDTKPSIKEGQVVDLVLEV